MSHQQQKAQTPLKFIPRLESLRGLAALMVALTHSIGGINITSNKSLAIRDALRVPGNGSAAVTIFFVLSGFVLAASLDGRKQQSFLSKLRSFSIRRAVRIWPAMLVVLAACFLWINYLYSYKLYVHASSGFSQTWTHGAKLNNIVLDALFFENYLNPVTWTLQVEMLAAIVFVPIWWICRKSNVAAFFLLIAWVGYFFYAPLYSHARTGFIFMFIFGILIPHGETFVKRHISYGWTGILFYATLAACCLVIRLMPETQPNCWLLEAVFAYWAIAVVASAGTEGSIYLLDHSVMRFIGRISYSFYLWHFPILFVIGDYCFSHYSPAVLQSWPNTFGFLAFIVSTLVTIPIAWTSHKFIEQPCINWSRTTKLL